MTTKELQLTWLSNQSTAEEYVKQSNLPFLITGSVICILSSLSLIAFKICKIRAKQDYYLLGLTIGCLLLGTGHCIMCIRRYAVLSQSWHSLTRRQCILESVHHFFTKIGEYSCAGFIFILSSDRCIALTLPNLYKQFNTKMAKYLVLANFILSTLLYIAVLLVSLFIYDCDELISNYCFYSEIFTPIVYKLNAIMILCVYYLSAFLYIVALIGMRYWQKHVQHNSIRQLQLVREKKIMKNMVIFLVSTVIAGILPMTIMSLNAWNLKSLSDLSTYFWILNPIFFSLELLAYSISNKKLRTLLFQMCIRKLNAIKLFRVKCFKHCNSTTVTTVATNVAHT
ncbi:hypothetical protein T4B_3024 [Trichinella pseudospiralis]|uniref:Uncharacterized protein n=2 Tax=Trichinella pseudospiralis TaxID=6337 RepID=A0A0V1IB09_TRIPS|nr:hypothetical protein T4D_11216 [Trichinella pseudospiralis]KRZ19990.1 hypothetical protein T4B_3024 [Trichinella pseudospiralis]